MKKYILLLITFFSLIGALKAQETTVETNRAGVSFAPLVEKLLPGVVNISTRRNTQTTEPKVEITSTNEYIRDYFLHDEGGRTSLGSGFLIDKAGYIVTNSHVIEGADEIIITFAGSREYPASVIGTDKMTDIALIKINATEDLPFVELGDSDKLRVGDWILAIGNPFGLGGSVTAGIVSAKSRDIDAGSYDNFIQTDASINQGSSGGPMFDMNGEVVGINTALFSSTGGNVGIGFATPINLSKFVIEQLMNKGKVERGWIGVKVTTNADPITLSDSQTFEGGAVVSSITEASPAATAGIEAGDIVIAFNGNDIKDAKDFSRRVAETPKETEVILRVWRLSGLKDIVLKVAQMPEKTTSEPKTEEKTFSLEPAKPAGYIENLGLVLEEKDEGVVISEVLADSDAFAQGLKAGDIILKMDGKDVSSLEDAKSYTAYARTVGGPPMEVNVMSGGLPRTLQLRVE